MENPLLFQQGASDWPIVQWDDAKWSKVFDSKILKFRIGRKNNIIGRIQFENDCSYENATFDQFQTWLRFRSDPKNPFQNFDPKSHWAYMGYQYMFELFDKDDDVIRAIDWSRLGLDRDGWQSTVWIGSQGAYTPCHYDTYGFNLVVQIKGRKRWTLFPPTSTPFMRPTRLPYEESSVFSKMDLLQSVDEVFVEKSAPRLVVLAPGDILLVPKHWWHFVQCLDDGCISVNTWVDLESDKDDRLSESIISAIITMTKEHLKGHLLNSNGLDLADCMNLTNTLLNNKDTSERHNSEKFGDVFLETFLSKFSKKLTEIHTANYENYTREMGYCNYETGNGINEEEEINERSIVDAVVNEETILVIKKILLARKNK